MASLEAVSSDRGRVSFCPTTIKGTYVWRKGAEVCSLLGKVLVPSKGKGWDEEEHRQFLQGCLLDSPYEAMACDIVPFRLPENIRYSSPALKVSPPSGPFLDPKLRSRVSQRAIDTLYAKVATSRPHRYLGRKDYFTEIGLRAQKCSWQDLIRQEIVDRQTAGALREPLKILDLGAGSGFFLLAAEEQNAGWVEGYGIAARDDRGLLQGQIADDFNSQIIKRCAKASPDSVPASEKFEGMTSDKKVEARAEIAGRLSKEGRFAAVIKDLVPMKRTEIPDDRYFVGNVENLSTIPEFQREKFDLVVSNFLFQYLVDPLGALVQAYRCLKTRGLMILHGLPLKGISPSKFKQMLENQGIPCFLREDFLQQHYNVETLVLRKTTPDLNLPIAYWTCDCLGRATLCCVKSHNDVDASIKDPKLILNYGARTWGEVMNQAVVAVKDLFSGVKGLLFRAAKKQG